MPNYYGARGGDDEEEVEFEEGSEEFIDENPDEFIVKEDEELAKQKDKEILTYEEELEKEPETYNSVEEIGRQALRRNILLFILGRKTDIPLELLKQSEQFVKETGLTVKCITCGKEEHNIFRKNVDKDLYLCEKCREKKKAMKRKFTRWRQRKNREEIEKKKEVLNNLKEFIEKEEEDRKEFEDFIKDEVRTSV